MNTAIKTAFAALTSLIAALLLLSYGCQEGLIFHPRQGRQATPAAAGFEFEELLVETPDGAKIHGYWVPHPNSTVAALWCHGNAGNISGRVSSIPSFHDLGLGVLMFDYRGFGLSEGDLSERGTYLDAQTMYDYLVEALAVPSDEIVIYGKSLGGGVAAHLASQNPARTLILDSTFSSIETFASELFPFLPAKLILRYEYPTAKNVQKRNMPVLVIHSENDEMIPLHHGENIFNAAVEPKRFVLATGDHNADHLREPRVAKTVRAILGLSPSAIE